ncbi:YajG family lipoprotein [Idiomarina sp. HP20-50]|uniref:YajG family lipoprotein n=1 Tax=Idiomarina sp. HP20-50 TaxID=3070813 RepID=UPI00294AED7C|nr:YajG family lipoprotein [Idiomarina sp. HP20-50]MDV6317144.1 YajG family lipoprotein [Idiomarina sp. HP20-50]
MFRTLVAVSFTLILSACQSQPDPLIISANTVVDTLNTQVNQLKVADKRTYSYLYRHKKKQDKAVFAAPQQPLTSIVEEALQPVTGSYSNTGLTWYVTIEKALIEAELHTLKYELEHNITLRVEATRDNRRYSNFYSGTYNSSGAMKPAQATIERQFKQLLNSVLTDIAKDPKLRLPEQEDF